MLLKGRKPLLIALASQVAAILVSLSVIQVHHALTSNDLPLWGKLLIACAAAGGTAFGLGAARLWACFLALLPALFIGALMLDLPVWVPVFLLTLLVFVMGNSLTDRVPLYLSNQETLQKLAALVPENTPVRMIDLGCGFATAPLALSRHNSHKDSCFVGVENAPFPFVVAKIRGWLCGDPRVAINWGSLWQVDLSEFDVVYAFLSPHPMVDLYAKASAEMSPGTRFISNSFAVPGIDPEKTIPIVNGRATALLVWTIKGPEKSGDSAQG